jgi:regulator of sigma E protease
MAIVPEMGLIAGSVWPFLFVLSLVVFFHELGNFLIGSWCGVKVDTFSLGFGPEIFGFDDRRGTHWRLALLPLGGYVKFHGDANGASLEDERAVANMSPSERAVSFCSQKVWKRAAIVAAGPIANFILAIVIFSGIFFVHGRAIVSPVIGSVAAGSPAAAAGFRPGDLIVSIDGAKVDSFEDVQRAVQAAGTRLHFQVKRGGNFIDLFATPRLGDEITHFGKMRVPILGVRAMPQNSHIEHYGLVSSVRLAGSEVGFIVVRTGAYVKGMIAGQEPADQLSGPIGIAEMSGAMAKAGPAALFDLAAILSISVGMLNLLPIPLLDGGHLLYYAIEAIRRKPMNARAQQIGFKVGFALVTSLVAFATYNDILHLTRQWMHWG